MARRRIIINIERGCSDLAVIEKVKAIMQLGRISTTAAREHYCGVSSFKDGATVAATKRNDSTDTFYVT